jgi:hypothetical protein
MDRPGGPSREHRRGGEDQMDTNSSSTTARLFSIFQWATLVRLVPCKIIFEERGELYYPVDSGPFLLPYVDTTAFQLEQALAELESAPLVA